MSNFAAVSHDLVRNGCILNASLAQLARARDL